MMHCLFAVGQKNLRLAALGALTALAMSLQPALAQFKVGLVLDRGGKDDKSFNSSAYEGGCAPRPSWASS